MKRITLTLFTLLLLVLQPIFAQQSISLKFNRTGNDASSVTVNVVDANGNSVNGITALLESSHTFKGTSENVTNGIICPDVNGNTSPTIELTFTVTGVPNGFTFNKVGLNIHALNGGSKYQANNDNKVRQWNVNAIVNNETFGSLDNIDIAAGVSGPQGVHTVWNITQSTPVVCNGTVTAKLTITKGATNEGCFFGLSEIILSTDGAEPEPEPEPKPEPEPVEGEGKVYLISWKNTGANFITEEADNRMTIQSKSVNKAQFWKFIPTEKENCFYIQNTATNRYIGSCNLTPSSASKVFTSATPVEYYVGKTTKTSGENGNCWFFSSTDCSNYNNESAGPCALNKDGQSDYIITWTAGVNNVGSYWKLIETEDLYELCPFDVSTTIGNIGSSYNIETPAGKNLTIVEGLPKLSEPDSFDENQE